jgi:hypothetical protein
METKKNKKARVRKERMQYALDTYLAYCDKQTKIEDEVAFAVQYMKDNGIDPDDEYSF